MKDASIRVIGIDPGLAITGIGIIDINGSSYRPVYCDCIITKKEHPAHIRLKQLYEAFNDIIAKYEPACMAIEELFFNTNVKTALLVGQARGVLMLAATNNNLEIYQYTPLQVKQAIVGYGRATKEQIKYMLKTILSLKDSFLPSQDDAWDALGIALCHGAMDKFQKKTSSYAK